MKPVGVGTVGREGAGQGGTLVTMAEDERGARTDPAADGAAGTVPVPGEVTTDTPAAPADGAGRTRARPAPRGVDLRQTVVLVTAFLVVLLALLLAVVVSAAWAAAGGVPVPTLALAGAFGVVFLLGAVGVRSRPRPAVTALWLGVLTVLWVALTLVEPSAVYLVLVLFFLSLILVRWPWGVVVTLLAMVLAVGLSVGLVGPSVGAVLGPVLSGLVAVVMTVGYRGLYRVSEERRELIEELMRARTRLAESERRAGVVAERERLAHEIHDTVAQGLSSIQMLLHAVERDMPEGHPGIGKLQIARRAAAENLRETRAMIAALQPAALEGHSLVDALRRVSGGGDVPVEVVVDGEERPLPMKVEAGLLRIAQGAVANIREHSGARRARITLSFDAGAVRLDVVDDGRGFDVDEVVGSLGERAGLGHVGLAAMERRAEEIGGGVVVESRPGHGTAVAVSVPAAAAGAGGAAG
ncbi:sensor histidine kinase [Corynebacterium bovis]|uniref:Sensor histidine kinase n=1 Tax=Corynebacterium bovis TaxID=36808 RepID=A0A3R8PJ68_9CORY|nr:sensor histidine kinase [Corynebacterium bovis]RRO99132.1 sensor histidine kinase [Corynebacterium bovis]RRQ02636.1 sensor histidine kinase [Corynebacterium bovis]RRQ02804.1 sensor histidine kinase [Corynebacterium bovis]RRQ05954.1 sensor histidine kinase [Corynebacterium bovis]